MCHHRYDRRPPEVEARRAPAGPIRIADADRERVVELLRSHAAAGRLDTPELEERLERAYAARYGSDLQAVLAELPHEPARRARPTRPRTTTLPLLPIAIVALVALAAVTGAWWLTWLIWPIVIALGPRRRYRRAGF
jgi:hypothetical protein